MGNRDSRTEPFPLRRRMSVDAMRMARRRNDVHGLVEFDVTDARRRIEAELEATGTRRSFTAFLVSCLARAVEDHPGVQRYRDWRGRVVDFDDVDVMVVVETTVDGERVPLPHVVRAADRRSLGSIHDEIRAAQQSPGANQRSWWLPVALRLPGFVRALLPASAGLPRRWKRVAGTVGVSSVGVFGTGGGWGITPTNYPLQLTVGGISRKPGVVDGAVEPREYLHLTVTVDHDVVDGAPAARFVARLQELVEGGYGLEGGVEG